MATILDKKYTNKDTTQDILKAIETLSSDESSRVLLSEHCEWLEEKLKEITRLTGILRRRKKL